MKYYREEKYSIFISILIAIHSNSIISAEINDFFSVSFLFIPDKREGRVTHLTNKSAFFNETLTRLVFPRID